ncbi:hypothetical protein KFU94_30610 [Chloroflexi bacterium TSY]|nr:hypothetical protein [Chloroflexi bacterium TSY]
MEMNRVQRKTLQHYQGLQTDQAAVFGQIRRNLGIYIYLLAVAVIVVPIGIVMDQNFGLILLGIHLGFLIRDIRHFIMTKKVWPVVADVLNWKRIEQLLNTPS